jgi:hypothetical protein
MEEKKKMAKSVDSAFNEFISGVVDLDSEVTKKARGCRDWLYDQLKCLPENVVDFPNIY